MGQSDVKKAVEVLGLNQDATLNEISKRYGILTRKFRTIEKDEFGYTMNDITKAYNLLMGITYIDKAEDERQKALRENPPLLSRITKKDPIKIENFFHYYKMHIIVGILVIATLFFTVRSCVNTVPADFCLIFYGNIATNEQEKISAELINNYQDITSPSVEVLSLNTIDPQYEAAVRMKIIAIITAKEADIIILDEATFKESAAQGMFLSLDDLTYELGFSEGNYAEAAEKVGENEEHEPVYGAIQKYGVDITESEFVKENGIFADNVIAAIVINSKRIEKAKSVLKGIK